MNPQRSSPKQIQLLPAAKPHAAKPHSISSKLLATGLFIGSIGGTFAIFGCVPLMARFISPASHHSVPEQVQAFPEVDASPKALQSKQFSSANRQAWIIFSRDRQPASLPSRSSL